MGNGRSPVPGSGLRPAGAEPQASQAEPLVPNAMVPYGPDHPDYPNAPSDWDGGPYLCRDGELYHMRGYGWAHGLGCWNATAEWDRIAYRPAIAIEAPSGDKTPQSGSTEGESAGPQDIAQKDPSHD